MPKWNYELRFRHLLSHDDVSEEEAAKRGNEMAVILRTFQEKHRAFDLHPTLDYLIEQFESDICDQDDFNNYLSELWDFCDAYRVWVPFGEKATT